MRFPCRRLSWAGLRAFPAVSSTSRDFGPRSASTLPSMRRLLLLAAWLCASCTAHPQDNDLSSCLDALRRELPEHPQVRAESFDAYTRGAKDLRATIEAATAAQPEFVLPIWDYVARRVDARRVDEGRDLLRSQAQALERVQSEHGVDAASVVAVFGVETDYGRARGRYPVVDATLSRACLDLSNAERKRHFFASLWLLQEGWVAPDDFSGSWAGAFGLTQFMPGTLVRLMDDGAARVDIVHSVPDALATTARYLKSLGWVEGLPWGVEVRAPVDVASAWGTTESGHACLSPGNATGKCKTVQQWAGEGVLPVNGADGPQVLPANTRAALLMPAGPEGPLWLVTANYRSIWRYNRADAYALAIGLLSDALRGAAPPRRPWPTDDLGVSRAELREMQVLLAARGHCDVLPDGAEGPRTTAAIREEEQRHAMPETGRAGQRILSALRADAKADQANASCAPGANPPAR